jgi:hypothetical protein
LGVDTKRVPHHEIDKLPTFYTDAWSTVYQPNSLTLNTLNLGLDVINLEGDMEEALAMFIEKRLNGAVIPGRLNERDPKTADIEADQFDASILESFSFEGLDSENGGKPCSGPFEIADHKIDMVGTLNHDADGSFRSKPSR